VDKFEKFTDTARKVLTYAQEEAQRYNHNYIGTEHLLLGLARVRNGNAARALQQFGVDLHSLRKAIEFIIGRGESAIMAEIGLTPRAKTVIEYAVDEARRLGHSYISDEHLLLGLLREGDGIAAGVLESRGVSLERLRSILLQEISQAAPLNAPTIGDLQRPDIVALRLDPGTLTALDLLVNAGVVETSEDAAIWFLQAGIASSGTLLASLGATVDEIERLRDEARRRAREAMGEDGEPSP